MTIKSCSLCKEINYIFYSDWARGFSLNLCYTCAKETGFNPILTTEVLCSQCQEPFKQFKKEGVCWVCSQKRKGNFKAKEEVVFIDNSKQKKKSSMKRIKKIPGSQMRLGGVC